MCGAPLYAQREGEESVGLSPVLMFVHNIFVFTNMYSASIFAVVKSSTFAAVCEGAGDMKNCGQTRRLALALSLPKNLKLFFLPYHGENLDTSGFQARREVAKMP